MKMESSRAVVDEDEKTKAGDDDDYVPDPEDALNSKKGKRGRGRPKKAPAKRKTTAKEKEASTLNRKSGRANNASPTKPVAPAKKSKKVADEDMEVDSDADEDSPSKSRKFFEEDVGTQSANEFPVILTTYDILLRDRVHLQKFDYSYIVVDEGHRLKNMDCALMKEIKKLSSGGRVVLTGTPLHVSSILFSAFITNLSLTETTEQSSRTMVVTELHSTRHLQRPGSIPRMVQRRRHGLDPLLGESLRDRTHPPRHPQTLPPPARKSRRPKLQRVVRRQTR